MAFALHITPHAYRQLKKLPEDAQKNIRKAVDTLCANIDAPQLDVKKLRGREGYRLRIGVWRVIYDLERKKLVVKVLEVGHRREIYH